MTNTNSTLLYRHFHRIAWLAVALATCVIVFGAFVRLSNAGLSCPDWPTCYGKAAWPTHADQIVDHVATQIRPVDPSKAWREQFHRMIAGTLTLAVIIFQALLGMWTVTWLLKPIVVMAHLLGGLLTFSLLTWMAWRGTDIPIRIADAAKLRRLLIVGLVLLGVQIALGGWTSANYAALACGGGGWTGAVHHYQDFPRCVGQWWPPTDFGEGFVLWRGIGVDYEGGILDNEARVAIQLAHRLMAVLVFGHLLAVAIRLLRGPGLRGWGALLGLLLCAQVGLGIANVLLSLPLNLAVLHNAGATALLFVLVSLLARLRAPDA